MSAMFPISRDICLKYDQENVLRSHHESCCLILMSWAWWINTYTGAYLLVSLHTFSTPFQRVVRLGSPSWWTGLYREDEMICWRNESYDCKLECRSWICPAASHCPTLLHQTSPPNPTSPTPLGLMHWIQMFYYKQIYRLRTIVESWAGRRQKNCPLRLRLQ